MRIISMVPSWTETLIEGGGNVVGRSRFCVHPKEKVRQIPAVGGTKNWNLEKVKSLEPNAIVLDKEENPLDMNVPDLPVIATHVQSVHHLSEELRTLSAKLELSALEGFAKRFEKVIQLDHSLHPISLPGVEYWIRKPQVPIEKVLYMIWKDPWMSVTKNTFIGSMLALFMGEEKLLADENKYPRLNLEQFDKNKTLLLFASEPFPFSKRPSELASLGFPSAIVDGEKWSWFGIRALRFLESVRTLR